MKLPERSELEELMTTEDRPWVSIFMPTHRPGAEGQQDPIRLKNLVRQAEDRLVALGVRTPDARKLLGGPQKLLEDDLFWRNQQDGLALYCAPSFFRSYRLPLRFEETLVVGGRPYVRPLLPLFATACRFFVLALSKQHVRFFSATRHSITELPLSGVPRSLDEAMKYDEFDKPRRARWVQPAGQGRSGRAEGGGGVYRGQGVEGEASKENLLRYSQMIDRGLHPVLREEKAPLVLAAVEYLMPIYREANTYAHLLEHGVEGNPDALKSEDLHRQAWRVVEPHFRAKEEEAAARFATLAGTGRASRALAQVVPAAAGGRVDTLWVARGVQAWGRFDSSDGSVVVHDTPLPGDQELLDFAAVQTMLHAGTVYALERMKASGEGALAATFRY